MLGMQLLRIVLYRVGKRHQCMSETHLSILISISLDLSRKACSSSRIRPFSRFRSRR